MPQNYITKWTHPVIALAGVLAGFFICRAASLPEESVAANAGNAAEWTAVLTTGFLGWAAYRASRNAAKAAAASASIAEGVASRELGAQQRRARSSALEFFQAAVAIRQKLEFAGAWFEGYREYYEDESAINPTVTKAKQVIVLCTRLLGHRRADLALLPDAVEQAIGDACNAMLGLELALEHFVEEHTPPSGTRLLQVDESIVPGMLGHMHTTVGLLIDAEVAIRAEFSLPIGPQRRWTIAEAKSSQAAP